MNGRNLTNRLKNDWKHFHKTSFCQPSCSQLLRKTFSVFFLTQQYFILIFFLNFVPLFVPKSGRAEGGRQTYIKGVESTSYLRLSESRKFKSIRTIRQCSMSISHLWRCSTLRLYKRIIPNIRSICNSVGLGIAYPRMRAMREPQIAG